MNCYTCEISFHGYFNQNRDNFEFNIPTFVEIGEQLACAIYEYVVLIEEDARLKQLKELEKEKHKRRNMSSTNDLGLKELAVPKATRKRDVSQRTIQTNAVQQPKEEATKKKLIK